LRRCAGNQRPEAVNVVTRLVVTVNVPSRVRRQEERQEVFKVVVGFRPGKFELIPGGRSRFLPRARHSGKPD
jgi:hypothetical protein